MSQNNQNNLPAPPPPEKKKKKNKERKKERKRQQNPFQGLINSKFKHTRTKKEKTHHYISDIPNIDLGILRLYCPQTRNTNSKSVKT